MRFIIAVITLVCAQYSWSMTPFHQHVYSTAQAVSAFYMYELSEGDDKYLDQFKQHQLTASRALNNSTSLEQKLFLEEWQNFQPYWKFNFVKGVGLNLDSVVRGDVRRYLTDVYLYAEKLPAHQSVVASKLQSINIITAMLSARLIDVVAAQSGSRIFTEHELQVNEVKLAATVQRHIDELLKLDLPKDQVAKIRKVNTKFSFVKKSLINYDDITPYFLVHRNVMTIGDLLKGTSQTIAGS